MRLIELTKKYRLYIGAIAPILLALLALAYFYEMKAGDAGTRDFIQYWSACKLLDHGVNPYDAKSLYALQTSVGLEWHQPVMMWNPPWTLSFLCPWMPDGFSPAAKWWLILNLGFLIASIWLVFRAFVPSGGDLLPLIPLGFFFIPALDNTVSGQLGLLLTFSLALFVFLRSRGYHALAGLALTPLFAKPYLLHIFWLGLLVNVIRRKESHVIVGIMVGIFCICLPLMCSPDDLIGFWAEALDGKHLSMPVTTVWQWRPDVPTGELRAFFLDRGIDARWLIWIVPLVGLLLFCLWYLFAKEEEKESLTLSLPILLSLSLTTAPYGWFSDFSVLGIVPIMTEALAQRCGLPRATRKTLLGLQIVLQTMLMICQAEFSTFWFPPVVGLVWCLLQSTVFKERREQLAEIRF